VTAKRGVQGVRERGVARTRIESMQEAARLAAPEAPPGFFLFADIASLRLAPDVLRIPWATAAPGKSAILDLPRA
jgi:hypothetical protein